MTAPDTAPPAPAADRLLAALRRDDYEGAQQILGAESGVPTCAALRRMAEMLMRRRQWPQAAWLFTRLPAASLDAGDLMKRRLAANLGALQQHRPSVYEALVALPVQSIFAVAGTPSGRQTVTHRRPDDTVISLSGGPDPLAAARVASSRLYEQTLAGEPVALRGVGDGYLVRVLADNPPTLFLDKQQPVFLIEPEPQILLQCLMIHDYTGAAGPIEQPRFRWFVGNEWYVSLEQALLNDLFLPVPSISIGQGLDAPQFPERLNGIVERLLDRDAVAMAEVSAYYDRRSAADFAEAFSGARRPPRVLLLTTRFSTVLQYSTRDAAAAFERRGWEARVMIEPSSHHRVMRSAVAAALAEFKPDLVFQIDHLRHEHGDLFPVNLPFACWIQDHLPHLMSREAGRHVEDFDFVLTDAIGTYADKFGYPARQCVPLPKLVVSTEPAVLEDARIDDLVFVSNASQAVGAMTADAMRQYGTNSNAAELITRCCRAISDIYERGDSLPTYNHVCTVLHATMAELSLSLPAEGFDVLARWMTHPFNDALYRQQALRWAAAAVQQQGLTLALYGKGWEAHPEFRPHARGPIAYGEPLRRLTRRSRINLQIVPYLCLHQRLLDGLMAGGFFLVRTHPADLAPAALLRFLDESDARNAATSEQARALLPPDRRAELSGFIEACRPCMCSTGREDVVTMTREWEEAGQITASEGPLPMLNEIGFHDFSSLSLRVSKFAHLSVLRDSISAKQRRSVGARLTYDAGIRRVVGRIQQLLSETADAARVQHAFREARDQAA